MTAETRIGRRAALVGLGALAGTAALGAGLAPAPARAQAQGPLALGVFTLGDPGAPVEIIEYASLTCPHCATFHREVFPRIKRDYVDTGKARVEFREVYFDRYGLWGGMLARCGGEQRYFGFVALLLERQKEWAGAENLLEVFQRFGRQAGLSDAEVEACLRDADGQRALVEMYQGYRDDPRLTGTPTIIVAGEKVADWSYDNLSAAIEAQLGG